MKILYICNEINQHSGWAVINYYTIKMAIEAGHDVTVFLKRKGRNDTFRNACYYSLLRSFNNNFGKMILSFLDAQTIKKKTDLDAFEIVHILQEPFLPIAQFLSHPNLLFTAVGTYSVVPFNSRISRFFYLRALKKVHKVTSISRYTAKRFLTASQFSREVKPITLGVEFPEHIHKCLKRERAICFVGHVKKRKGLLFALKALNLVQNSCPKLILYVIGNTYQNEYLYRCINFIKDHNLSKKVIFLGTISEAELHNYYGRCMANILPSINVGNDDIFEGFGLVHLEANVFGTPSIGSFKCGNEDAILNGKSGYLCHQGDIHCIAEKIRYLYEIIGTSEYEFLSEKCVKFAKANSWHSYFVKLNDFYHQRP